MSSNQYAKYTGVSSSSGGGSAPSIGGPITGGTDGSVLFVHPAGVIAQDNANFNFNDTTHALTITGPFTASNFSGSSSGTNTGDVTLAAFGSTPNAIGLSLSGQVLNLQPADATHPGGLSIADWNTFNNKQGTISIGALDAQAANANGLAFVASVLSTQSADATHPGMVNNTTQTFSGNKTFTGTISASNLSGTNTGDVTLTAVGASPNANAASLSGQALTLQPADGTNPGVVTAGVQTFGGNKTFTGTISASNFSGSSSGTNTGDVTLAAFGSTPNANGLSLTGQVLNMQPADATHPGGLSIADWNTFNNKQPAGSYITALTGDVTATGPGSVAATLANVGTPGTYVKVTTNAKGLVTSGSASPLGISDGGTGQTTKAAAFDALSPMTTGGDIIYGGASGTGTRLPNGSSGQVLTSTGGTTAPTWATPGSGSSGAINYIANPGAEISTTGWATYAGTPLVVLTQNLSTNGNVGSGGAPSGWTGQSFTPSSTGQLGSVVLKLFIASGSGQTGNIVVDVYTDNAGNPGTLLETSTTLDSSTLTGSPTNYTFNFTGATTLTSSTLYHLVHNPTGVTFNGANIALGFDTTNPYAGGYYEFSSDSGATWTPNASDDLYFIVNSFTSGIGNIPATGSGGSAAISFSRSTSSPLVGVASFLITQPNSTNVQGNGVSYDFTIDSAFKNAEFGIDILYNASSTFVPSDGSIPLNDGTTSTNSGNSDLEVFIYDITNTTLIYVNPEVFLGNGANNFQFYGTFKAASNSTSYRLIIHAATANANATGWSFKFDNVSVSPVFGSTNVRSAYIREEEPSGTNGGTFTSGAWQTRILNTSSDPTYVITGFNGSNGTTANQFMLPAGSYNLMALAPARGVDGHVAKLYNISDSVDVVMGQAAVDTSVTVGAQGSTSVYAVFTITSPKIFEIQHQCTTTGATNGLGSALSFGTEVYTQVHITKLS